MKRLKRRQKSGPKLDPKKRILARTTVVYGLAFLAMTSLILRAAYLQVIKGQQFRQSELTTQFAKIPVLPQRGWIYDANGQVLAYDTPTVSIVLDQYTTLTDQEKRKIANLLAPVLETTTKVLISRMQQNTGTLQTTLASDVNDAQTAFVVEHQSELPNVEVVQDYTRKYPYGDLAGQVLGYVGAITAQNVKDYPDYLYTQKVGVAGLEYQYEHLLQGKPGYDLVTMNASGDAVGSVGSVPPIDGDNIQVTLDGHEQAEAQMILQTMIKRASGQNNIEDAGAVMLNTQTGGVLAMVSYPYLDPNWFISGYSKHEQYLATSGAELNNAIQTYNYPGSTVKPANLLAALKTGAVTPNTVIDDPGYLYVGTQRINEDEGIAFGAVDVIRAIVVSSDVFFYQVGLRLGKWFGSSTTSGGTYPSSDGSYQNYLNTDFAKGINTLFQGELNFGLGAKTGIDLPGEASGAFYIEDENKGNAQVPYNLQASEASIKKTGKYVNYGSPASLADAAIGQSQQFTPMQLANYVMTLANNGKRLQPHLLEKVYSANGTPTSGSKPLKQVKPDVIGQVKAPASDFQLIKTAMAGVISNPSGTAYGAFTGAPYQAAGKTGTAQIYINGHATDNSVFICYAPVNHPLVAVAVMAPGGGYGASFSAIVARQMIDAYFDEHHEPFMPKKDWTSTAIPSNWKSSPAYQVPEQSK